MIRIKFYQLKLSFVYLSGKISNNKILRNSLRVAQAREIIYLDTLMLSSVH